MGGHEFGIGIGRGLASHETYVSDMAVYKAYPYESY